MNSHTQHSATTYRRVATLFVPLLIIAAFSNPAVAQRAAFLINHQLNPLKSFVIASMTESHPYFVDIDADGDQDCFVGEYTNGGASRFSKVYFFRNEGNSKNPSFRLVSGTANPLSKVATNTLSIPYFIDIDADGDQDCFIGEGNTGALLYYKNTGTATQPSFEKQSAAFNPLSMVRFIVSGVASPAFGDVDGDGDQDCVIADQAGTLSYFRNVGTATSPRFEHVTSATDNPFSALARGRGVYNLSFADWNKDGLVDLFINTTYFKNTGTKQSARFAASGSNGEEDAPMIQGSADARYTYTPLRFVNLHGGETPELVQGNAKGGFIYQTLAGGKAVEIAKAASFKVAPNPSKGAFTLNLVPAANGSTIRIMDMSGKVLTAQTTRSSMIRMGANLNAGVYLLEVLQDNKVVFQQKLIKQ